MNIAIVGTGYVGLVSGTCFAEMGATVTCVDVDANKINKLKVGEMPIYEPGLEELVKRNVSYGRLNFTTNLTEVLDDVEVVFSAVGTPPDEDGSADLKYVLAVAHQFGQSINKYTILVTKSTVPVGTARKVKAVIQEHILKQEYCCPFPSVSMFVVQLPTPEYSSLLHKGYQPYQEERHLSHNWPPPSTMFPTEQLPMPAYSMSPLLCGKS